MADHVAVTAHTSEQEESDGTYDEVTIDEIGDLGISVRVDADGTVVVSKLLQSRGYAELACPSLRGGDVLVAIDNEPIIDLPFAEVMQKLHAAVATRPTRLEFASVDVCETAARAAATWRQSVSSCCMSNTTDDDLLPHLREGEFEVTFDPQQPTGLRFSESYIMTNPLKLAHIESALLKATGTRDRAKKDVFHAQLLHTILVRVGEHAVLGAPVDDVMALLYEEESFPKSLWLATPEKMQDDNYNVVTLTTREQLMWLCFVPVEMMMEVPMVSYAALASDNRPRSKSDNSSRSIEDKEATHRHHHRRPRPRPRPRPRARARARARSDGVRDDQYLMAINGFPTLRISGAASSRFTTTDGRGDKAEEDDDDIVTAVTKSLGDLLAQKRTLRFRDLQEYRREFLAHEPLSPWQRRRDSTSTSADCATGTRRTASWSQLSPRLSSGLVTSPPSPTKADQPTVWISHWSRGAQLLTSQEDHPNPAAAPNRAIENPLLSQHPPKPLAPTPRYLGLANCEGTRAFRRTAAVIPANLKCVVIPDNCRPVGIQLETDLASGLAVFKKFLRRDGPAQKSRQVHVGDKIFALNGIAIDDIPTDLLLQILRGEDDQKSNEGPRVTASSSRTRSSSRRAPAPRRRVLRLERQTKILHQQATTPNTLFAHAKKALLRFSQAHLQPLGPSEASSS